jgi:hypothetical protein
MNINLGYFSNHAVSFFKDKILSSLTSQQKKIVLIASIIFGCISAYYIFKRCCFKAQKAGREKAEILEFNVARYEHLNQELILELERESDREPLIKNTGLTQLLVEYAFRRESLSLDGLNALLGKLADEVLHDNETAYSALTRPNNPTKSSKDLKFDPSVGYPQNTPLCLLVKGNNLEGSQSILPVYEAKDILFTTPRGNSVLHLAVMTGQMRLAFAIMDRAKELGVLDELLNLQNIAGKTADEAIPLLTRRDLAFRDFLDVSTPFFGGEEINKALIGQQTRQTLNCRARLLAELEAIAGRRVRLADIQGSFADLRAKF